MYDWAAFRIGRWRIRGWPINRHEQPVLTPLRLGALDAHSIIDRRGTAISVPVLFYFRLPAILLHDHLTQRRPLLRAMQGARLR